VVFVAKWQTGM